MPRHKIDDLAVTATSNNDPILIRYLKAFPGIGEIDLEKGEYQGYPMTDEQKETVHLFWDTDISQSLISIDKSEFKPILDNVKNSLESKGLSLDHEYKGLLRQMAMVMGSSCSLRRPAIITTRPGLGKTEMLISTLIAKSKAYAGYTALIVTAHVRDAIRIRDDVNAALKKEVCFVRPSFTLMTLNEKTLEDKECDNGKSKHYHGICRDKNCKISTCPAKDRYHSFRQHKIVLITNVYFNSIIDDDKLNIFMDLPPDKIPSYTAHDGLTSPERTVTLKREELYIDENPGMIFNETIDDKMLNDCMVHMKKAKFNKSHIHSFKIAKGLIASEMGGEEDYEHVDPISTSSKLTRSFKAAWRANPHKDYYKMPELVNGFIEDGGIRQNKNNAIDYAIGVNRYRKIAQQYSGIRTVILDGTGIKDLTYKADDFNILEIPEIRDFSRAKLHHYAQSISKTYLNNKVKQTDRIEELAAEAIKVISNSKGLFITYKVFKSKFVKIFERTQGIDIKVEHYGNLIGRNDLRDRTTVFFAGINNWGSMEYFSKLSALKGNTVDLSTFKSQSSPYGSDEVNDFSSSLIAIGLYQDLMRSNLRMAGSNDEVNIYIWTPNRQIIDNILDWLQGTRLVEMVVPTTLVSKNQGSKPLSPIEMAKLDKFKANPVYKMHLKPKIRAISLTDFLSKVPIQEQFEYVWGPIPHGHYSRYEKHAAIHYKKMKLLTIDTRGAPST
jgi:hypothetical protein